AGVLTLLRFHQACLDRRLNTQEGAIESGLPHPLEQLRVFGEVDAGFGDKGKGTFVPFLPLGQVRQKFLYVLFVTDEIVVDNEDRSAPSSVTQCIELGEHLRIALGSRNSSVDFNDVTELTIEWTPARVLNGHRTITLHISEFEIRHRS